MKIIMLFPFLFVCLSACHSKTIMQTDTYILPVDYIEYIDIDKSTIKLNSTGLKKIKLVDFQSYNYFAIEKCKFKAMVLPFISSLRLPEPLVYIIGSPLINKGIIILEIDHLDTKEKRQCKEELKALMTQTTCSQQDTIFLQCNDFKILAKTECHLDIEIVQESKIKEIAKAKEPIFCFQIEENKYIAKGNEILKSSVPENCDYFYLLGVKNEVMLRNNNILHFIKIPARADLQWLLRN